MLEFNVRHQRLSRVDSFRPAENSVNYLHAKIKFLTNEWTGSVRLRAKSKSDTIVHEADIVEGCVQIPWEALRNTDGFSVSVYTRNGDIEITTNYVDIYLSGTLPGGSESNPPTPTELELIRQEVNDLRNDVDNLEGEGLANAVADYLKENPVQAGATAEEAAQIAQNKQDIENLSNEKLDASKLPEAVNDALAQAKESGEFKGEPGEPGPAYVLTDADKQEIAEQAAELVEVPDGYVKTINGIAPDENGNVEITIPDSGGNVDQSGKTPLDKFMDNVDIDYEFDADSDANYTVIRVYRDKIDGEKQYPFVYALGVSTDAAKPTLTMAKENGWLLAINAGIFGISTYLPDGIVVQNGTVLQNTPSQTYANCFPLTIDSSGNLGYADADADAAELVGNGIVSAVCGFMPIIIDYEAADETITFPSVSHFTDNAQRQIIGQFANGDYAIITCEGRENANSDGWTIAEAQAICKKLGLKFAYNLDGGGSTGTVLGAKQLNTVSSRRIPTFIVFTGDTVAPEYAGGTVSLASISVVYSGGEVTAGTALTDLTGIVVTATYSDGSTATVTDYTLSGEIAEGENTITVSYGGKTTTFIVTGVTVEPDTTTYTIINNLTNVTTSNSAASAEKNTAYSATLTAASGYELGTVTVTMGGVDVTTTSYSGGVVTIASVTGNVVITATGILVDTTEWVEAKNVVVVTPCSFNTSTIILGGTSGRACALSTVGTVAITNNTGDGNAYYGIPIPSTATKVKIALAECGGTPAPIFLNESNGALSVALNVGWQTALAGIDGVYEFAAATYDYFACNFKSFGSATDTIKIYFA